MPSSSGALEAVERILNRGGAPDDVLRAVVAVLHERGFARVAILFADGRGPAAGTATAERRSVVFNGRHVADLELASTDETLAPRVATLISAVCAADRDASRSVPER